MNKMREIKHHHLLMSRTFAYEKVFDQPEPNEEKKATRYFE